MQSFSNSVKNSICFPSVDFSILYVDQISCLFWSQVIIKIRSFNSPKKWKNVDFLIKLEPIKIRQEKRISPTVNWCKNAGSLCRWVFCLGRYTL